MLANLKPLEDQIKELIVKSLRLENIQPQAIKSDEPLFVEGLGSDSIDALELAVALSKQFGVMLDGKTADYKKHFASVHDLALFVAARQKGEKRLSTLKTKEIVAKKIKEIFHSEFGIALSAMQPEAHLYKDLGLDSIDAIDLAVRLEVETGLKLKAADLKSIQNFQNVVDVIWRKLQDKKIPSKK